MQHRRITASISRRALLRAGAAGVATVLAARAPRASAMTYTGQELYDDFERANTVSGLGTAVSGQPWAVSGASLPRILSGQMTNDGGGAGYAYMQLRQAPRHMAAQIQFGAGVAGGVAGLIAGINFDLTDMCHLVFGSTEWYFQVREMGGAFVSLLSGTYSLSPNTPYQVGVRYVGAQATVELPTGTEATVVDARVARLNGPFLIYEPMWSSGSGQGQVKFDSVEATTTNAPPPLAGSSEHRRLLAGSSEHRRPF